MSRCLVFVFIAGLSLSACGDIPDNKFEIGQFVKARLSGQKGMVLAKICYKNYKECRYKVRFSSLSITTNTHFLGSDDPVTLTPFSAVYMREYELENYVEK